MRIIKICPLPLIVCSNQQWISCAVKLNPKDKMYKLIRTYTKIMGATHKLTEPDKYSEHAEYQDFMNVKGHLCTYAYLFQSGS